MKYDSGTSRPIGIELGRRIRAEQVTFLYTNAPYGIFATIIASSFLAFVLWGVVPPLITFAWLGINFFVAAVRYILTRKYQNSSVPYDESPRWEAYFNIGLFFAGAAFGSSGVFLFPEEAVVYHVFLAFVLGGMMAGSVGTYSVVLWSSLIYNIPLLFPVVVHFFHHGGEMQNAMGTMLLIFFGVMLALSRRAYSATNMSIILRLENEGLLEWLKESEERYRKHSDATFEGIVVHREGRILDINNRTAEMFGVDAAQTIGKSILGFLAPQCHDLVKEKIALQDESTYEMLGLRKDGTLFNIEVRGRNYTYRGELVRYAAIRDITEQKSIEENLKKSELSYRTLTENLPGIVYRLHLNDTGDITFYNNMLIALTGHEPPELTSGQICALEGLIVLEDRQRVLETIRRSISSQVPFELEYRIRKKDGEERFFFERSKPVCDNSGEVLYIDGFVVDITDRKLRDELAFTVKQYKDIFDVHNKVFFSMDVVKDRLLMISKGCEKVYGLPQREFFDNTLRWREVIHPDDLQHVDKCSSELPKGNPIYLEYRYYHADGSIRWIGSSVVPTMDRSDKLARIDGINEDITERKITEKKIAEYASTQEVLLKEVNHRVKNNLNAIIGMMRMETQRARKDGYLELLNNLIGRVSGLASVHSMLSSSGWSPLRISSLAEEVMRSTLRSIMPRKEYDIEVCSSEAQINSTQVHHLAMLLNELVSNSVNHAQNDEPLKIALGIEKTDERLTLRYSDNGKGFSDKILQGYKDDSSMGLELITGITKESLRGDVCIYNNNGANTVISFELDEGK